jgi:hypothetical protein
VGSKDLIFAKVLDLKIGISILFCLNDFCCIERSEFKTDSLITLLL